MVELSVRRLLELLPGQTGNVPCVVHFDVFKVESDGSLGFGEGLDAEMGSERDGGGNGWFAIHGNKFTKDNDFARCGNHEWGCHWR